MALIRLFLCTRQTTGLPVQVCSLELRCLMPAARTTEQLTENDTSKQRPTVAWYARQTQQLPLFSHTTVRTHCTWDQATRHAGDLFCNCSANATVLCNIQWGIVQLTGSAWCLWCRVSCASVVSTTGTVHVSWEQRHYWDGAQGMRNEK